MILLISLDLLLSYISSPNLSVFPQIMFQNMMHRSNGQEACPLIKDQLWLRIFHYLNENNKQNKRKTWSEISIEEPTVPITQ